MSARFIKRGFCLRVAFLFSNRSPQCVERRGERELHSVCVYVSDKDCV
uniref:Uncharacterized protein n=1 Tax=Anguilla anguilla TaxID=7936 RepID=A0A0E9VMF0_ANGAN